MDLAHKVLGIQNSIERLGLQKVLAIDLLHTHSTNSETLDNMFKM